MIRPPLTLLKLLPSLAFLAVAAAAPSGFQPGWAIAIDDSHGRFATLAIDPVAHRLLAAHERDGTADFFDLDAKVLVARVPVGPVVGLATDPTTGRYFASAGDDRRVAIIDRATWRETGSIPLPAEGGVILFDARHRLVYVTQDDGAALWAIDPEAKKIVATIAIAQGPAAMAADAANGRIYVCSQVTGQVSVVDTATNTVVAIWPTAPAVDPHSLVLDAAHARLFVAGDNGQLVALDIRTGRVVASTAIDEQVGQLAFDPEFRRIYCAAPDWLTAVQATGDTLVVLGKTYTATTACNVAVDLRTHAVWTTFTDGEDAFARCWIWKEAPAP